MSFERFEPARAEELQSSESVPADGKKVGWDKSLDTLDSTWDGKKPEKRIPTIEETALKQKEGGVQLNEVAQKNPDWPPAKWNPESEARIANNMESALNTVI